MIGDFQLDSYSETAASPVLLYVLRTAIPISSAPNTSTQTPLRYTESSENPVGGGVNRNEKDQYPKNDDLEPALKFSLLQEHNPFSGTFHYR